MTEKRFRRVKENFACERCGFPARGSGYTNHCPRCLWSKHVDVNPGDRRAACRGLMEPAGVELKNGRCVILHRCVACGRERRNKAAQDDSFDAILRLSSRPTTAAAPPKEYNYRVKP
jgi:hypothetical protein